MGYIVGIRCWFLTWFLTWRFAIQWGIRGHHGCSQHFHGYCQLYNGLASLETPKWRNISFFMEFRTPYPRRLFYSAALLLFMSNIGLLSSILFTIRGLLVNYVCLHYMRKTRIGEYLRPAVPSRNLFLIKEWLLQLVYIFSLGFVEKNMNWRWVLLCVITKNCISDSNDGVDGRK